MIPDGSFKTNRSRWGLVLTSKKKTTESEKHIFFLAVFSFSNVIQVSEIPKNSETQIIFYTFLKSEIWATGRV